MSSAYVAVKDDPRKLAYIKWLTTPRELRNPPTEKEFAESIDVYPKTLYNWRHDREFIAAWQDETNEVVGGDDKRQEVIDALYKAARDPKNPRHVQAAKLYLETLRDIAPPKGGEIELDGGRGKVPLDMLTTEELEKLIDIGVSMGKAEI